MSWYSCHVARRMIRHTGDNSEAHSLSGGTAVSWTLHSSKLGRQLGQAVPQNPLSQLTTASLSSETRLGGAGSLIQVGSASGLADSRVREAGSGHCSKSSKHPTKFRAATWNVGTLKSRSGEVVEKLSRRRVDLCGVQEHRWAGCLATNQASLIKGKDSTFKFFWCGKERGQGGVGFLLAEKWVDKVFDVLRISDRIILIRLVIGKVLFTFLSVYAGLGYRRLKRTDSTTSFKV